MYVADATSGGFEGGRAGLMAVKARRTDITYNASRRAGLNELTDSFSYDTDNITEGTAL